MPSVESAGTALFLKRWLRRPLAMGAVMPSGRLLAQAMAKATKAALEGRPGPCRRAGRRHRRGHQGAAGRGHRAGTSRLDRARSRAGDLPAPPLSRTAHHRGRRLAPAAAARRPRRFGRCRRRVEPAVAVAARRHRERHRRRRVRGAAARRAPWCSSPTGRRRPCRAPCASACSSTACMASASGATSRRPWSGPSEGRRPRDLLPFRRRPACRHHRPSRPLRAAPPRRRRRPEARGRGGGRGRSRRAGRGGLPAHQAHAEAQGAWRAMGAAGRPGRCRRDDRADGAARVARGAGRARRGGRHPGHARRLSDALGLPDRAGGGVVARRRR